jgi:hypothetical protein
VKNLRSITLLIALFLGLPFSSYATSYAFINGTIAHSTNANSITSGAVNATGGDLITITVSVYDAGGARVISDSQSNSYSPVFISPPDDGVVLTQVYQCRGCSVSSSQTFTVTCTGCYPVMVVEVWSGSGVSPVDQSSSATTGANTILAAGSITPTSDNQLVLIASGSNGTTVVWGVTSPYSPPRYQQQSISGQCVGLAVSDNVQTTATATNPAWNSNITTDLTALAVSFKVSSGVPPTTGNGLLNHMVPRQ